MWLGYIYKIFIVWSHNSFLSVFWKHIEHTLCTHSEEAKFDGIFDTRTEHTMAYTAFILARDVDLIIYINKIVFFALCDRIHNYIYGRSQLWTQIMYTHNWTIIRSEQSKISKWAPICTHPNNALQAYSNIAPIGDTLHINWRILCRRIKCDYLNCICAMYAVCMCVCGQWTCLPSDAYEIVLEKEPFKLSNKMATQCNLSSLKDVTAIILLVFGGVDNS